MPLGKMVMNSSEHVFLSLLKAGLWEQCVSILLYGDIDYAKINRLSEEQSVVGLVSAGIEQVADIKVPQEWTLQVVGATLQIEQRNEAMNAFIEALMARLALADIDAILVKGQGVAQCYERPLWRACGDIDSLLDKDNYIKAHSFLTPLASEVEEENKILSHLGMKIGQWEVELHGTLHSRLWKDVDKLVDEVQDDVFDNSHTRVWKNGEISVKLPSVNNDVIFIFVHLLQHFFRGGIGLRQVCDLIRLLWTYRTELDVELLNDRLKQAGLMSEWQAFAALAVDSLGMPEKAMPFYSPEQKWSRKAERIIAFILETGNFGHNRDNSYYSKYSYVVRKAISLWRYTSDALKQFFIFPMDSMKVWRGRVVYGLRAVVKRTYGFD